MNKQVDWEGLKALHEKRKQPFQGKSLTVANDIIDSSLTFLKLLDEAFPGILAQHEADQKVIEAAKRLADSLKGCTLHVAAKAALAEFDKVTK